VLSVYWLCRFGWCIFFLALNCISALMVITILYSVTAIVFCWQLKYMYMNWMSGLEWCKIAKCTSRNFVYLKFVYSLFFSVLFCE
jgi:hypothetical protein